MSNETPAQELARLKAEFALALAENAKLKAEAAEDAKRPLTLKVSEKGAVSIYGMGRFPVTLYGEQWAKLIAYAPAITKFMADNKAKLRTKEQSVALRAAAPAVAAV